MTLVKLYFLHLVRFQISENLVLNTVCKICFDLLKAFDSFHAKAVSSQETIKEALSSLENSEKKLKTDLGSEKLLITEASLLTSSTKPLVHDEETTIEFLKVDNKIEEIVDSIEIPNDETSQIHHKTGDLHCSFCLKTYKRQSHLKRHIEKLHKDGKVKKIKKLEKICCSLCGKRFVHVDHYKNHQKEVCCIFLTNPQCRFCNETFQTIQQLQHHLKIDHPAGRKHFCEICFKTFPTASNKNSHMETHNPEGTIRCSDCNQGFKSVLYLRKHQKGIHMKVDKVCPICDRSFESQLKFNYHVKTHELVKRYKCDHKGCDKSFMQHHHLENHKTTHTKLSKFLCFKCGKEFRQECNLKVHLKNHEMKKEIEKIAAEKCENFESKCPECGKKFNHKSSLRVHFQSHFRNPDDKPHKCPHCDQSFYQERSMKCHFTAAHGIGNFQPTKKKVSNLIYFCDFCSKAFKLQSLLKRHLISHVEEEKASRKHKCDKCEARFKRPEHLRTHTNSVHLKLRPFKCDKCNKSFTQVGDRNLHMKTHSDEKNYKCLVCQKAFRLAKGLKAHRKTHVDKEEQSVTNCQPSNTQTLLVDK